MQNRNHPCRDFAANLFTVAIGCSKHESATEASMDPGARELAASAPADAAAALPTQAVAADSVEVSNATTAAQVSSSTATYTDAQRKFIRTAQAQFRVKDVYQSALTIGALLGVRRLLHPNELPPMQLCSVVPRDRQLIELAEHRAWAMT